MNSAGLILDVDLGLVGAPTHVAWCQSSNLLAVATAAQRGRVQVAVLDPQCPQDKAVLNIPLAEGDDGLVALAWSPPGCRRMLLTATAAGALLGWTQDRPQHLDAAGSLLRPQTVSEWWGISIGGVVGGLAAACWLALPQQWSWDGAAVAAAEFGSETLKSMFVPGARGAAGQAAAEGVMDWLRPGLLALAVVSLTGDVALLWSAIGREGAPTWSRTTPQPLPAGHTGQQQQQKGIAEGQATSSVVGAIVAAHAVADGANGVLLAYVCKGGEGTISIARLAGDPVFAAAGRGGSLPLTLQATCTLPAGSHVQAVRWDPSSAGGRLASVTVAEGAQRCTVHLHSVLGPGQTSQLAEGRYEEQLQGALQWAADGSALALPCKTATNSSSGSVQVLSPASLQPLLVVDTPGAAGGPLAGCAFSPNSTCLCAASAGANSSLGAGARLRIWCLPQCVPPAPAGPSEAPSPSMSDGATAAKMVAGRLAWAMVVRRHGWDAVQAALQLQRQPDPGNGQHTTAAEANGTTGANGDGASCSGGEHGTWQAIRWVDTLVHAHPEYSRPNFCSTWDRLKLGIAVGLPCAKGRLLAADVRLRLVLTMVLPVVVAAMEQAFLESASKSSKDAPSASRVAPEEVRASAPWLSYFTRLLHYLLCCFKAWATARLMPPGQAAALTWPLQEGVPGVHLMPDMYAARQYVRLHQVLGVAGRLLARTQEGGVDELAAMNSAYETFRMLFDLLNPPGAYTESNDQQGFVTSVQRVQGIFGDMHQLHYCRLNPAFALPATLAELLERTPGLQALPLLSAHELHGQAMSLGLLPPQGAHTGDQYYESVHLHSAFRADIGHGSVTSSSDANNSRVSTCSRSSLLPTAKRRRWAAQQRVALGADGGAPRPKQADLISGTAVLPEDMVELACVDGSLLTPELTERLLNAAKQGTIAQQLRRAWLCCAPLTGNAWKRART